MSLVAEFKRRNVFRVVAAYLVVGWLLTEVLTTILPTLGAPEWVSKAVILVFAFGFIPTVVLAWFYELTPAGIKHEREVDRADFAAHKTASKLDYLTVAAIILLIVFVAFFSARYSVEEVEPARPPVADESIAVLPFVNMSNDEDNEYFSDGLTETLLHMLTQVPDLKVAARTSSFAFKNQSKTVREIAGALEVAHVLEGSVQRFGERVRITAQLIRAADGFHVWSDSYDRTLDDIFVIQDEIAEKVSGALLKSLLGRAGTGNVAGVGTESPDAYDLYLQAIDERATFSFGGLQASEDLLKGALLIDSDFLDAKTELANNYLQQVQTGLMAVEEAVPQIVAITDQVLAVRPDDVGASATRLYAQTLVSLRQGNPDAAFDAIPVLEELVARKPTEQQARILLTDMLEDLQQFEKALQVLQEAVDLDPFNPAVHFELGSIYARLERWDEARAALEKSLEIEPAQPNAYAHLAEISIQSGDGLDFLQQLLKAIKVDPRDPELPGIVAAFLYSLDLIEEGDDFRDRVMAIAPTSAIAYRIELVRAIRTGDEAAGVASARRAIEDDVEDRQFAYVGAVQYLLREAARRGTVDEEMRYLESHAPGILDIEASARLRKYRGAQFVAFDAWYTTLPRDELLRRLNRLREIARSFGADPLDDPGVMFNLLALQGEVEAAIDMALQRIVGDSVLQHLDWRQTLEQAQFREIVADSRIQDAMRRWDQEEAAIRDRVRSYLSDLQAST